MPEQQTTCPVSRAVRIALVIALGLAVVLPVALAAWTQVSREWQACSESSTWRKRGEEAFKAGDYTVAVRAFARARSASPGSTELARLFSRARVNDTALRPETLQGADMADVLMDVEAVEAAFPADKATTTALRGFLASAGGSLAEGAALYRKALDLDPNNGPAHLGQTLLLRRDPGKLKEAAAEAEALVKARPKSAEFLVLLGRILLDMGDMKGAAARLTEAVAIRETADSLRDLGSALVFQNDAKAAVERLVASTRLDGRDPVAWSMLAQALLQTEKFAEAESAAKTSLGIQQTSATAFRLAQALNAQRKYQESLPLLQQLASQRDIMILMEYATALEGTGRPGEAMSIYRTVLGAKLPEDQMQSKMFQQIQGRAAERLEALQGAAAAGRPAAPAGKGGKAR